MNRSTSADLQCLRSLIGQVAIACSISLIGLAGVATAVEQPTQQHSSVEPNPSVVEPQDELSSHPEVPTTEVIAPASKTTTSAPPASPPITEPLAAETSSKEGSPGSATPQPDASPSSEELNTTPKAQESVNPKSLLKISQKAADLGDPLGISFSDLDIPLLAQDTQSPNPGSEVRKPPPISRALNLWSVRSLRKPVGRKVLDTGVSIAGPQLRDMSENFWTRDYLTGNWGGLRDTLYDAGIEFTFAAFIDIFGNVSGGNSQNTAYSSVNTISFDFFTERMGLWPNGQIHWTNAWIDGADVSVGRNYAGAFNSVFFADPPRRGLRLFELWYGHLFFDGQLDIRLGKIYPFVKFGISQVATVFQNSNFGYPGFLGTNRAFGYSTLYGAAPFGLEILYAPKNSPWFAQAMVMDGFDDPTAGPYSNNRNANYRGLDLVSLRGREGVEGLLEAGYKLNQEKGSTKLPGTYRVGFQWHTGEFESFTKDANGGVRRSPFGSTRGTSQGNYAFYFVGEQMLYRESADPTDRTQGLSAFLKGLVVPPGDVNTIGFNVAGGLVYEGPFPGRNRDLIGIGVAHTGLSSGARELARNSLGFDPTVTNIPGGETALELMYAAEIAPWWLIIFSVQHIINPSFNAFGNTPNATVLGISTRFGL